MTMFPLSKKWRKRGYQAMPWHRVGTFCQLSSIRVQYFFHGFAAPSNIQKMSKRTNVSIVPGQLGDFPSNGISIIGLTFVLQLQWDGKCHWSRKMTKFCNSQKTFCVGFQPEGSSCRFFAGRGFLKGVICTKNCSQKIIYTCTIF